MIRLIKRMMSRIDYEDSKNGRMSRYERRYEIKHKKDKISIKMSLLTAFSNPV